MTSQMEPRTGLHGKETQAPSSTVQDLKNRLSRLSANTHKKDNGKANLISEGPHECRPAFRDMAHGSLSFLQGSLSGVENTVDSQEFTQPYVRGFYGL